jgi:hypothetical protein
MTRSGDWALITQQVRSRVREPLGRRRRPAERRNSSALRKRIAAMRGSQPDDSQKYTDKSTKPKPTVPSMSWVCVINPPARDT